MITYICILWAKLQDDYNKENCNFLVSLYIVLTPEVLVVLQIRVTSSWWGHWSWSWSCSNYHSKGRGAGKEETHTWVEIQQDQSYLRWLGWWLNSCCALGNTPHLDKHSSALTKNFGNMVIGGCDQLIDLFILATFFHFLFYW